VAVELAIVVPTLNERENIAPLLERLEKSLDNLCWEVIFVDDDSPDGTSRLIRQIAQADPRVRVLQRVGRRGLASACLEGMMASAAPILAVMDADLQHDETLLPRMVSKLKAEQLDLVVASRNLDEGGMGDFPARRVQLSRLGAWLARLLLRGVNLTDPMSGFFVVRREFLDKVVRRTSGIGFKLLLDLIASSPEPVRLAELPYRFRNRQRGESKLDLKVSIEFIFMILDKLFGNYVPARFLAFVLAGVPGLALHLLVLGLLTQRAKLDFFPANAAAIGSAMTLNFFLNNWFTWRDARLRGKALLRGLGAFYLVCSLGALLSFALAQYFYDKFVPWYAAGLAGMAVASVWNFAGSQVLTWRRRRLHHPYG
jgi:dolichol-phosphate mannosyltransferase